MASGALIGVVVYFTPEAVDKVGGFLGDLVGLIASRSFAGTDIAANQNCH
jgi:hypothetical protein